MGILYIVATPIGNLKDVTLRALATMQEVDFVLAEDTRVTKKLFSHYNIQTPLISYHQQSKESVQEKVFELLSEGKNLALVTDAGTPGISDPGNELIAFLLQKNSEINMVPIPGPSALTALASIAGVPMDKFLFLGYPPHKRGRAKFFQEIAESKHPVIFYESPHRIIKSLTELSSILDAKYKTLNTRIVVGRELTKHFETIYRGKIEEVQKELIGKSFKGEFAILVDSD
jgi:16S rRNA (cytidine1402-2'-O)-methyltransferase